MRVARNLAAQVDQRPTMSSPLGEKIAELQALKRPAPPARCEVALPGGADSGEDEARLSKLADRSTRDLRAEWRRLFRAEPPYRLSRDLLIRGLAYKIQERTNGGPNAALKRRLRGLAEQLARGDNVVSRAGTALRPGARLVREWRGASHTVTVMEDGFDYDGQRYRSLSQIAKAITGGHWSGPRFFGLTKAPGKGDTPDNSVPGNGNESAS